MTAGTVEAIIRTRVEIAFQKLNTDYSSSGWMAVRPLNRTSNPALEAEPARLMTLDDYFARIKGMRSWGEPGNPAAILDYDPGAITSGFDFPQLLDKMPPIKGNAAKPTQRRSRSRIMVGIDNGEVFIQTIAVESYGASLQRRGENSWVISDIERITLGGSEIIPEGAVKRQIGFGLVQAFLSAKQPGAPS